MNYTIFSWLENGWSGQLNNSMWLKELCDLNKVMIGVWLESKKFSDDFDLLGLEALVTLLHSRHNKCDLATSLTDSVLSKLSSQYIS